MRSKFDPDPDKRRHFMMHRSMNALVATVVFVGACALTEVAYGQTLPLHVRAVNGATNPPLQDGTSWATAYRFLRDGITEAHADPSVTEIWVAKATYLPDRDLATPGGTGNSELSFEMKVGLAIYGGFEGDETSLGERDLVTNVTILSGDINGTNSYHVLRFTQGQFPSQNPTAIVDGFTITAGNAIQVPSDPENLVPFPVTHFCRP